VRILVDPSAHAQVNVGDIAMLRSALRHLRELWPDASIGVITATPERLAGVSPDAVPVPAEGRQAWLEAPLIGARLHQKLPSALRTRSSMAERIGRRRVPSMTRAVIRAKKRLGGHRTDTLDEFLDWARSADLVLASGAGLLADPYVGRACSVLELLETAIERGVPTAMMGQGVGPVTDPDLRTAIARVLPRVDLIGLRESRSGPPILRSLGVAQNRLITTGDEAIEQALDAGTAPTGKAIGVNVRVARYSGVSADALDAISRVVRRSGQRHGVDLVPLPTSFYAKERDAEAIASMLGSEDAEGARVETPAAAIERVRRCRVVVTGSYHAAVFALAQGIPAVGLAGSGYYVDKFLGLAGQFEGGCATVRLDEPRLGDRLEAALEEAWNSASSLANDLRRSAGHQVEQVHHAYARLGEIVGRTRSQTALGGRDA
jgi:polysaccharide pyruvyl transferase WcaK-like protein